MTKITSDFLWLASAMEGWISATLLLEYLQEDIGVREIIHVIVYIYIFTYSHLQSSILYREAQSYLT